jgi:glycerophosphoryl diester phosphodiesterase
MPPSSVWVIAHRGASGIAPENTQPAFSLALELGARAVEFDVQLTRDNVAVVFHDETLERTTNGSGVVAETDFHEIADLDAGSWFSPEYRGVEVPTLEEVLASIGGRALMNVELKPDARVERLARDALAVATRLELLSSIVFSSFDPDAVRAVRRLAPEARIGVLCMPGESEEALRLAAELDAENLHPARAMVDQGFVAAVHARGRKVWAWTANETEDIDRLIAAGVDGLFTDYVDRVRSALQRAGKEAR